MGLAGDGQTIALAMLQGKEAKEFADYKRETESSGKVLSKVHGMILPCQAATVLTECDQAVGNTQMLRKKEATALCH